jgi:hypothetical protein
LQKRTVSGAGSAKSSAFYEEYPQAKHEKSEQYKKNGSSEYGEHGLKILVKGTHRLCRLFQTPLPKEGLHPYCLDIFIPSSDFPGF